MRLAKAAAMVALGVLSGCGDAKPPRETVSADAVVGRPNVIVILADDLGYADISAYGGRRIHTPNIDRIATTGALFTEGYSAAPVCSPSRAGLQTGRYPGRYGFEYNNGPPVRDIEENLGLDMGEQTIAEALGEQGYATALIGKWHLGANDDYYPLNRGYDEFVGLLAGATAFIDPSLPGVISAFPDGATRSFVNGRTPETQIVEGPNRQIVHNEDEYLTDYLADRAVEFIEQKYAGDAPYFLYLAFTAPHDPLVVTQQYYDRFPHIADEGMRVYAAMVASLDDAVGAVLDALDRSGEADNTIVVFASDNGCAAYIAGICSCEPLRGGKLSHFEGGLRVPFLMRWPAVIDAGQIYRNPVTLMDVFPTMVAAAGGRLKDDRIYDGVDLIPFLTGADTSAPHEELMWRRGPMASIRKGDWKLWKSLDGEFTLLFNLSEDPNEADNRAGSEPERLRELEAAFELWAQDLLDPSWPSRPPRTYDVCGTPFKLPI